MPTKDEVARRLANAHFSIEPGITRIFKLLETPESEALAQTPIKLLEINVDTPASGILPLYFGPAPAYEIPYPSVIVEVTPHEYEELCNQALTLPEGWTIGEEMTREAD